VTDRDLDAIRHESDAFWTALEVGPLTATVRACPGWTLVDLGRHIAEVHSFWATIVADRVTDPKTVVDPAPPTDDELIAYGRAQAAALLDALRETDPATPVWTWAPQKDVAFVRRHQIGEAALHRWDAQQAIGRVPDPIEQWAAADGIDEFLTFSAPQLKEDAEPVGGSVELRLTDGSDTWTIDGEESGAHAVIEGSASAVLLVLNRRLPLSAINVSGDPGVAQRFIDQPDLD
jgi:uncharacterized protein (TIGR03083 family)